MAVRYMILDISTIRDRDSTIQDTLALYDLQLTELLEVTISALTDLEAYYQHGPATDLDRRLLYNALSHYNRRHNKEYTLEDVNDVCSVGLKAYKRLYPTILSLYQQHPFTHLTVNRCVGDDLYVECG